MSTIQHWIRASTIGPLGNFPPVGQRVQVWMLEDRLSDGTGRWCADHGKYIGDGEWLVGIDPHAIVSHWKPEEVGP